MQLEAISSHPMAHYLGDETNTHLTTTSFQVVVESNKVSPQPLFLQSKQPEFPQLLLIRTFALDPSPALLLLFGCAPAPECLSCSEGPRTAHSLWGAASPVQSTDSWYKPGCWWPSWPSGHTAGSCSAGCPPTPPKILFPRQLSSHASPSL